MLLHSLINLLLLLLPTTQSLRPTLPFSHHGKLLNIDPSVTVAVQDNIQNEAKQHYPKSVSSPRRQLAADTCTTTPTTVASGSSFSLGGTNKDTTYANTQSCTWLINGGVAVDGTIGVAFTFFHTEENQDTVQIYDASDNTLIGTAHSGDELTPFVVSKDGVSSLKVVFTANEAVAQSSRTLQLGFSATVFDAGTQCYSADSGATVCSGHGTCSPVAARTARKCVCSKPTLSETSDAYFGDDCSVKVAHLAVNTKAEIRDLAIGKWSYFWSEVAPTTKYLVDFKDVGDVNGDPLLVLGSASTIAPDGTWNPVLPRLSSSTRYYEDYLSWYYDRSDIHYIHFKKQGTFNGNRAIIAIFNHVARASKKVDGDLTLRSSTTNAWPCIMDCSGHGTCSGRGQCTCAPDWYGNGWRAPDTCEYQMKDITNYLDEKIGTETGSKPVPPSTEVEKPIRVGAWAYYKLVVSNANWVGHRTIAIDFTSLSPHAQPIVVVKKGSVPRLKYGYLPTYDAFDFDFGDENGFELLQGSRQNIVIPPSQVELGNYYIGIYDIWGHTALPQESHDSVNYTMYVNKYAAGTPCPKDSQNQFCAGKECDFNKGICKCPPNALGLDCSMVADELDAVTQTYVSRPDGLVVKGTEYFYVKISRAQAISNMNLLIELVKLNQAETSFPVLLARQGDVPFGTDRTLFDDHDYVSRYHESETHRILLDREELEDHGESIWYFAVVNEEDPNTAEDPLTYKIRARLMATVDCLTDDPAKECSGHGTCDTSLGRCTCVNQYTGDDCGDAGVFALVVDATTAIATATTAQKPSIPADAWVYYSISIGCNTTVKIDFTTASDASRPLVVMEKDRLPLMVDATHEYDDYYSGVGLFSKTQSIRIAPCDQDVNIGGQLRCYLHPLFPGTDWKTGSPTPGEWYIGIYNDPDVGGSNQPSPIVEYTLKVTQETKCNVAEGRPCAAGFREETKQCQTTCPGMHPEQNEIFSNSPMDIPAPCDKHGTCSIDGSTCSCDTSYFGDSCSKTCPSDSSKTICSGHGTCGDASQICLCDAGFGGTKCDVSCKSDCSGHGSCDAVAGVPVCKCAVGYSGTQCSFACPIGTVATTPCSGHGKCTSRQSAGSIKEEGYCQCDATHTGIDCGSSCPSGVDNQPCSGVTRGTCSLIDGTGTCACLDGFSGKACEFFSGCQNNCNGHGECKGELVADKKCLCKHGFVGNGCNLQCPVTSLSGEICEGKGTCSALDGIPVCTCDPSRVGKICQLECPMGSINQKDTSANSTDTPADTTLTVCSSQGTCVVDDTGESAACACLDGYGGKTCSVASLTEDEALEKVQDKVDTRSILIASIVSVVSILIIIFGTVLYKKQRSRLRQYEVTFGTDALLGGDGEERTVVAGRSVKRTERTTSASLAAEDVLAGGFGGSVQMSEIVVDNSDVDYMEEARDI